MTCLGTTSPVDLLRGENEAIDFAASIDEAGERPTVTPAAVAEVRVGAHLGSEAERASAAELVEPSTWLGLSRGSARLAGEFRAGLGREGNPTGFVDCLIAAVAIEHGESLVTRDADFERIDGLGLLTY